MDSKIENEKLRNKQGQVVSTLNDIMYIYDYSISTDFRSMNGAIKKYIETYKPENNFCWKKIYDEITPFEIAVSFKLDKNNIELLNKHVSLNNIEDNTFQVLLQYYDYLYPKK